MRTLALSDEILMKVDKAARYIGGEVNSVMKDKNDVDIRFAMCFPDVYEIGMSNLGMMILYNMFNQREDVWCERLFSPWPDLDKVMREQNIPLFALESQDPVKEFDFLGITLQYEMCYTNVLQALDLAGIPLHAVERTDEDPIVIGGGPAGLSCAYFLALQGYRPTVFEKNEHPGGMLRYGIPSFKLEKDVIDAEIDILRELGVTIRCGVEVGKDVTLAQLRAQGYKAFYLAIGCQGGRTAGVPGEDAAGIQTAVALLRTVGGDESHKMTGKTVVIGGGNVAIDAARVALRCGSSDVTMVCLEPREKMPASAEEIAEAEEEGTAIRCGYGPKEFLTKDGHVCGVVLKRCTGLYDAEGRFAPTYDESVTITLPCDNVVLSIGQCIQWGNLLDGEAVQLGRGQGAVADAMTYQTAQSDIFVGGDVYTGPRFAIDAIAAGKQGAISIHRFVQPNTSLTIGRNRRDFYELDKTNLALGDYDRAPRQAAGMDDAIDAHRSFRDAHLTLTEAQVKTETARCLGCGASVVDPNKCIGCGVCTTKCEFDAIHLHRDLPECSTMVRSEDKFKAILPYMAKREVKIRFGKKDK